MMLGLIFLFLVCIPVLLIVHFTDKSAMKPNGNIILGSTVPSSKMKDKDLLKIVEEYKKVENKFILVGLITSFPILFLGIKSVFTSTVYLLFWCAYIIIGESSCLKKAFNKIQNLKRKNDWFILSKRVISVDTEVSKQKNKMVISKLYFIPSLIINIIAIIFGGNLSLSLSMSSSVLICFLLYIFYLKRPTIVYSKNTIVNLGCNLVYRREWSIVWVTLAFVLSVPNLVFIYNEIVGEITLYISSFLSIIIIFKGFSKIRDTQNKLLGSVDDEIYVDDDEYWKGMFYNNPNDSKFMVDKRVGIGTTINFAHPGGKVFVIVTGIILAFVLIISVGVMFKLSNAKFDLKVSEDKVIIEAPMYDTDFDKEEIEDISLISEMPRALRTNGADDGNILLGNFKVKGYGDSKVYVKNNVNKIVVIRLNDKYVFISGDNEEESQDYYDELNRK